ncbi:indolepyruvate ferredoxin oxidoreductase family protein [Nocardioides sp. BYT-33-1]|uniref:indolepyruvate ferredoxin oxidoreductase family protein n=1 Tax=Nocardioides sp. BYT-33-1 TaxID=3416952 RepID=UPI003F537BBC
MRTVDTPREFRPGKRYELPAGETLLTGLQALVRLVLDVRREDARAGLDTAAFVAGYEGSPLAGFDLELQRQSALLDEHRVVFKPAVNEELAATAVQGSQLASVADDRLHDGVLGVWYGKAPGLDRATDAVRHAVLGGTAPTGGVLALVGDDATAKSSTVPSSSEAAMAETGMVVLAPCDAEDILFLGRHGVALSRFSGLWVGLKLATNVVDGGSTATVHDDAQPVVLPSRSIDGEEYVHAVSADYVQPTLGTLERSLTHQRPELARRYARANGLNRVVGDTDARVGIVAAGGTYLDVLQALSRLGIDPERLDDSGVRLLRLGMVAPLDPVVVTEFAEGLDEIVVVEEKRAFIELAVKDVLYGRAGAPAVHGRRGPDGGVLLRADADLPPALIAAALAPRIGARLPAGHPTAGAVTAHVAGEEKRAARIRPRLPVLPLVNRTPFFCSGCPHNRSTEVPDGSLVAAGIGCHGLATMLPAERVGQVIGLCQMGGEGSTWIGMEPFVGTEHLLQNLGDGTFHHSGSLAVRNAVAAGSNITFKLLYNGTVAMTGGQDAVGGMSVPRIAASLLAEGARRVVVTSDQPRRYRRIRLPRGVDVRHRDDLVAVQEELAVVPGVTVLIHEQECATELRRKRKRGLVEKPKVRAFINTRVCEGCGDCGAKSNCLSVQPIETEFGRKTQIHQASCNIDLSCLDGDCPSFLTVVPGRGAEREQVAPLDAADLPAPVPCVDPADFGMRITGIGGTGVVTTAQVLATAAAMAGFHVRNLDQLGMAQKGGAVVSDLRLSTRPILGTNKLAPGECDLYLGCDLVVAASPVNLEVADPSRTVAVVSTSQVPTGAMVRDVGTTFPDPDALAAPIRAVTRGDQGAYVDVRGTVLALCGDDQFANIFQVGMAVQCGALPVPADVIEEAIGVNGVAVEANLQAFRRGRQIVADPDAFRRAIPAAPLPEAASARAERLVADTALDLPDSLRPALLRRVDELIRYQDAGYARRYLTELADLTQLVAVVPPGEEREAVQRLVVENLFKLMAYKDEYEVARLSIDPQLRRELAAEFGTGARFAIRLQPPLLRALGMRRKIALGAWVLPILRLLYGLRRLRGTPFDVFGYARVRRTERALVGEYVAALRLVLPAATADDSALVRELAGLPDVVRGYEEIKLANVERFRARRLEIERAVCGSRA